MTRGMQIDEETLLACAAHLCIPIVKAQQPLLSAHVEFMRMKKPAYAQQLEHVLQALQHLCQKPALLSHRGVLR